MQRILNNKRLALEKLQAKQQASAHGASCEASEEHGQMERAVQGKDVDSDAEAAKNIVDTEIGGQTVYSSEDVVEALKETEAPKLVTGQAMAGAEKTLMDSPPVSTSSKTGESAQLSAEEPVRRTFKRADRYKVIRCD